VRPALPRLLLWPSEPELWAIYNLLVKNPQN